MKTHNKYSLWKNPAVLVVLLVALTGCATMGAGDPRDPIENVNRSVFNFNEFMDEHLFDPVGEVYTAIIPGPLNKGISNFFSNIRDISVIFNDILQFKVEQTFSDVFRFVFNSSIGLLGFFDVATHMGLEKHHEDFGKTLAHWGIGSGPYVVLPFFGPSTVRDAAGRGVDMTVLSPITYVGNDAYKYGMTSTGYIDFKADLLSAGELMDDAALDRYEFVKNAYLTRRESQINGGQMPEPDFEEFEEAPAN